ncbi:MAG: phosphoribosylanthranilate isomerase [Pseudomonadota bacterium]
MSAIDVKICGLRDLETATCAARAGARYLGFVFFRKSPRYVTAEAAAEIVLELKQASFEDGFALPEMVGLFVDAGEKEIAEAASFLTHLQFHGNESPERCVELGAEFGVDVIKALAVSDAGSFSAAEDYQEAADLLLFDAKPGVGATRPGGHGVAFDWSLLKHYEGALPFLLAGGLTPDNVTDALGAAKALPGFQGVDVSSGVEAAPGKKDPAKIDAFVKAALGA